MNYRFYSFVNFYLSDIQRGIQTAHCVAELHNKYTAGNDSESFKQANNMVFEWSNDTKTIIVLNGGNCRNLNLIIDVLFHQHVYPWVEFYEDEASLNSALTCVGVILPEKVWNPKYRGKLSKLDKEMKKLISSYNLA